MLCEQLSSFENERSILLAELSPALRCSLPNNIQIRSELAVGKAAAAIGFMMDGLSGLG